MIKRIDRHSYSSPQSPTPLPLELRSVGYSFWSKGATYERTHAHLLGVEMVIRGRVELMQNGRRFTAEPGDLYILHRGSRHRYTAIHDLGWTHKRFAVLTGTGIDGLISQLGLEDISLVSLRHPKKLENTFRELWTCCEEDQPGEAHRASNLIYSILLEANQSLPQGQETRLSPVLRYMQLNLHRTLNREDFSRVAKMSYPHLNRLFKVEVGQSPVTHFESLKMERARFYLLDTSWSIQQIALQLGYSNPLYFSTRYRHHHGISPRAQRKEQ